METTTAPHTVEVTIQAEAPWASDPYERVSTLAGVPRKGDDIVIWHGNTENYFDVKAVTWVDALCNGPDIRVVVSTDGYDPEQVRDIFASHEMP